MLRLVHVARARVLINTPARGRQRSKGATRQHRQAPRLGKFVSEQRERSVSERPTLVL